MIDPQLSRFPYRPPAMTRGIDPRRMNWLWRLICELAEADATEVLEALHESVIPADLARVRSWMANDHEASFFPISMAELERNVRALIALRQARGNPVPDIIESMAASLFAELARTVKPGED